MISVILSILKLILIIIACILGLIILILCLILFVPIRYEAQGRSYDNISAKGRISWLLRIFSMRVTYIDEDIKFKFTIFGITIFSSDKEETKDTKDLEINISKKRSDNKKTHIKSNIGKDGINKDKVINKKHTYSDNKDKYSEEIKGIKTNEKLDHEIMDRKSNGKHDEEISIEKKNDEKTSKDRSSKEKTSNNKESLTSIIIEKLKLIKNIIFKVLKTIMNIIVIIYNFLLQIEAEEGNKTNKLSKIIGFIKSNKLGFKTVIKAIKDLLNHIKPRSFKGDIEFGSGEPPVTGQILGLSSIFYGLYHNDIKIIPNFEEKVLKGQVYFKGRIRLFTIAIIVIRLVINKSFRSLWKDFNVLKEEL